MRAKFELRRSVAGSGGGVRAKSEFPVSSGAERLVLALAVFHWGWSVLFLPSLILCGRMTLAIGSRRGCGFSEVLQHRPLLLSWIHVQQQSSSGSLECFLLRCASFKKRGGFCRYRDCWVQLHAGISEPFPLRPFSFHASWSALQPTSD